MNVQGRKKTLGRQKLRGISRFLGIKCLCVAAGGQTEPSVSFYSTVSFWAATSLTLMQNKLVPKPLLAMSWLSVYCLSTHTEKWGKLVSFHEVISAPISMLRCFLHMKNKNAPLSWRNLIFLASWDQQLWYFPLKIKQNNLFELEDNYNILMVFATYNINQFFKRIIWDDFLCKLKVISLTFICTFEEI